MNAAEMRPLSPEGAPTERPRNYSARVVILLLITLVVCGGLPTWLIVTILEAARCTACENNLKQLSLGLRSFDDANGGLPPAYLCDENGKPTHSWQSLAKPFLGCYQLRKGYSMKEPWDGPNNSKYSLYGSYLFRCPSAGDRPGSTSDYVAVVGPDTMWPGQGRVRLPSEEDSNRDLILLIEMPDSDYNSMAPRSPTVEEFLEKVKSPTGKGIRCIHSKGLAYVTVGGSVRWFPPDTDPETIRRLLKRDPDCTVVSLDGMTQLIDGWENQGDSK